jgi:hypothetical protein
VPCISDTAAKPPNVFGGQTSSFGSATQSSGFNFGSASTNPASSSVFGAGGTGGSGAPSVFAFGAGGAGSQGNAAAAAPFGSDASATQGSVYALIQVSQKISNFIHQVTN